LLHHVAQTGDRELFLIIVLLIGLVVAWLSSAMGLSLVLGVFLAGLAISESDYHHQAFGNIVPFRDIFASFFFVSIGMMLDLGFVFDNPLQIPGIVIGLLLVKTFIAGMVAFLLGFPFRTTVMAGLALSQAGEFSIILSGISRKNGLISGDHYQLFLSVTFVTMALTPFILMGVPAISNLVMKLPLPEKFVKGLPPVPEPETSGMKGYLLIIGMGINETNVARAAKVEGIQYAILDVDANRVRQEQKNGEPAFYVYASISSVLRSAGGHLASVV